MAEHSWTPDPNGPRIVGRLVTTADFGVADDIVTRLRNTATWTNDDMTRGDCRDAADEIEWLRERIKELETERDHWQRIGASL